MQAVTRALARFPRMNFSLLPTPLHRLERLSTGLGVNIWCKRDDLTGFAMGGNKTRKLDFLVAAAVAARQDTLIAVGANQSNFCRMAAGCGVAAGLQVHLVLGGRRPAAPTGNPRLDHLFGVTIHHIDSADWDTWEREAAVLERQLAGQGRRVCRLPVGGSTPDGALGYVAGLAEIVDQAAAQGVRFEALVLATSSAGTQAGLVAGKRLTGWPGRIIGMAVAKDRPRLEGEIAVLAGQTAALVGAAWDPADIIVDDAYLGDAYAARTAAGTEALELFARREGIMLDHVYTGKAAAGLIDYARQGRFAPGADVLFLHTGGNVELFE